METLDSKQGELLLRVLNNPGVDLYREPFITVPGVPSDEHPSFGEFLYELEDSEAFLKCMCRDCVGVCLSSVKEEFRNEDFLFPIEQSSLIALFV